MQAIPIAECYLPYTASLRVEQPRPQGAFPWPGKNALGTRLRVEMILESYAKVYLINSRLEIARFS